MSDLSSETLQDQIARLQAELENLNSTVKADLSEHGLEFFQHVIDTHTLAVTESTGRVGLDVYTLPFTGSDGEAYTVSLHFTAVTPTAVNKAALAAQKAAQKAADAAALKAKKQADVLQEAMGKSPRLAALIGNIERDAE